MKKSIYIFLVLLPFFVFQQCKTPQRVASETSAVVEPGKKPAGESLKVSSIFIEATKERLLGNTKKAIMLYQQCLDKDPRHAPSYYEIARLFQTQFNLGDAVKMAKKAADIDPDNQWYTILIAELYQGTGQNALAVQVYRGLLEKHPGNLAYSYQLANLYMRISRFANAIEVFNNIEKQTGINEEISLQKQKLHMLSGNIKDAIAETERLSAAFPRESRYYSMLAELHLSNKEYDKALGYYKKVLDTDPMNPYIHISMAEYYREIGNTGQSFTELKKGFGNANLDIDTKIQVMSSFYNLTEKNDAPKEKVSELIEALVKAHPNDPKSHSMLADFLIREERYAEAREAYRKVAALDPSRYVIWENLCRLDLILNDLQGLDADSRKTIELFPLQPMPYMFAGIGAHQGERLNDAIKIFNKGKDFVVDDNDLAAEFYMYLGDTYNQVKDYKLSDQSYEKSLQLKPDNPYVLNNFSYFLSLRKVRLEEAETMARRANEISPNNKNYLDTYAWVLYQKGNYPEARKWLEMALEHTGTDSAVVLEHYGDILYKLGQTGEAQGYWKKAKETGEGSEFLEKKIKDGILYE